MHYLGLHRFWLNIPIFQQYIRVGIHNWYKTSCSICFLLMFLCVQQIKPKEFINRAVIFEMMNMQWNGREVRRCRSRCLVNSAVPDCKNIRLPKQAHWYFLHQLVDRLMSDCRIMLGMRLNFTEIENFLWPYVNPSHASKQQDFVLNLLVWPLEILK